MRPVTDPGFVVEKAEALVKENRMKDALQLYTDWLTNVMLSPLLTDLRKESIAIAYNNRGHLKYLMVDFEGAVQDYNAGLEYNSILPCLYYNRGTIMYRMGHFTKAVQDMLIAARLAPDCTDFQVALQRCTDQLVITGGTVDPISSPEDEVPRGESDEETNENESTPEGDEQSGSPGATTEEQQQRSSQSSDRPAPGVKGQGHGQGQAAGAAKSSDGDEDSGASPGGTRKPKMSYSPQKTTRQAPLPSFSQPSGQSTSPLTKSNEDESGGGSSGGKTGGRTKPAHAHQLPKPSFSQAPGEKLDITIATAASTATTRNPSLKGQGLSNKSIN